MPRDIDGMSVIWGGGQVAGNGRKWPGAVPAGELAIAAPAPTAPEGAAVAEVTAAARARAADKVWSGVVGSWMADHARRTPEASAPAPAETVAVAIGVTVLESAGAESPAAVTLPPAAMPGPEMPGA